MLKLSRLWQHNHQNIRYSGRKKTELTTDNRQKQVRKQNEHPRDRNDHKNEFLYIFFGRNRIVNET